MHQESQRQLERTPHRASWIHRDWCRTGMQESMEKKIALRKKPTTNELHFIHQQQELLCMLCKRNSCVIEICKLGHFLAPSRACPLASIPWVKEWQTQPQGINEGLRLWEPVGLGQEHPHCPVLAHWRGWSLIPEEGGHITVAIFWPHPSKKVSCKLAAEPPAGPFPNGWSGDPFISNCLGRWTSDLHNIHLGSGLPMGTSWEMVCELLSLHLSLQSYSCLSKHSICQVRLLGLGWRSQVHSITALGQRTPSVIFIGNHT